MHQGQAAYYRVKTQTVSVEISGMEVMQAQKKPLLAEDVKSRMERPEIPRLLWKIYP